LVLTLDHDAARDVSDANCGISGIDVLASGPRCAIRIDTQVFLVNFDFDVFVYLWINKQGSE
jgi:hypothetical protein